MSHDRDEKFWGEPPSFLDDPLGWGWAWWRRVYNVAGVIEFGLFLVFGVIGTWRFFTRRLVTEDLFVFTAVVVLGALLAIQGVLKRRQRD